jgi:hypothetical protein
MRDKSVWDAVNKMPVYPKKSEILTEEQVKRVMLDYSEVNPNCSKSVRKYGERCEMAGELYNGYKNYMKIVAERDTKPSANRMTPQYQVGQRTMEVIERLVGYKDEYIG